MGHTIEKVMSGGVNVGRVIPEYPSVAPPINPINAPSDTIVADISSK